MDNKNADDSDVIREPKFDEIGPWSQVKLEIVRDYAAAYSTILAKQAELKHVYIDAFSGAGLAKLKVSKEYVPGSPLNALLVDPPFRHFYFIDLKKQKASFLRKLVAQQIDEGTVSVFEGDANSVLLEKVFPNVRYRDYMRALCLLDPYGLHLDWKVVQTAGQERGIELFINFPVYDININVLPGKAAKAKPSDLNRMDRFWGDSTWHDLVYRRESDLFGADEDRKINRITTLVKEYRKRLKSVAGFDYVPEPIPMKNTNGGIIYYLFFASPNRVGGKIVGQIFKNAERFAR